MCRWFDSLEYNWEGLSKQPNLVAKAKRSVWQFFPHTWDSFHWQVFSSPMRCLESLAPIVFILIAEVSSSLMLSLCYMLRQSWPCIEARALHCLRKFPANLQRGPAMVAYATLRVLHALSAILHTDADAT